LTVPDASRILQAQGGRDAVTQDRTFLELDGPDHISSWERHSRMRWKAAIREGSVYQREAHVLEVRKHVAGVVQFLKATRASLEVFEHVERSDARAPYVWTHRR
jgi:hypothetical protein